MPNRDPTTETLDILGERWHIAYEPKLFLPTREVDWVWWHDNYDGPEDHRCGCAASKADCLEAILDYLDQDIEVIEW